MTLGETKTVPIGADESRLTKLALIHIHADITLRITPLRRGELRVSCRNIITVSSAIKRIK